MYSIALQDSTGLWVVVDDDTGKNVARGDTPLIAINLAIEKGMPSTFKTALLTQANAVEKKNKEELDARIAADTAAQKAREEANAKPVNNLGGTTASDDAITPKSTSTAIPSANTVNSTPSTPSAPTISAPAAPANTIVGNNPSIAKDQVGSRLFNPLSNFSSYTYQLSLYMLTPDAYEAFAISGRKNINTLTSAASGDTAGAFLIAQSGGINNTTPRAPGFENDFYIENLKITTATGAKSNGTSSNNTDMKFDIVEPMGFSFITKLKKAFEQLKKGSKLKNYDKAINASRSFFVLGIRFQGYDKEGKIANSSQYFSDDTRQSKDAGGVYERFYEIMITSMKFKLHGGATVYNITAATISTSVGLGVAKGMVNHNIPVTANTVANAIGGKGAEKGNGFISLLDTLNENEKKSAAGRKTKDGKTGIPNIYGIEWQGPCDFIKKATLKSKANPDKKIQEMSSAAKTLDVNDATSTKALSSASNILVTIPRDTPIPQAIKLIIMGSSYLEDALTTLNTTTEQNDKNTNLPDTLPPKTTTPPPLRWYNLSTKVRVIDYDTTVNDFAYEITYVIQPYETPAALSPYGIGSKYYGPHKSYQYYFTGQNSEIITFEQNFDNTFFNVVLPPSGAPADGSPVAPDKRSSQENTIRSGNGFEAQNTYLTSLFDPGAYANSKITILGDPDYLTQETPDSINDVYRTHYKNDGYTINCNGGHVFIEVNFNEAIDYDTNTGTLQVNDSILFWDYSGTNANIKGVSYMVTFVESIFSKGKFTQNLTCVINPALTDTTPTVDTSNDRAEAARLSNYPAPNSTRATAKPATTVGVATDQPVTQTSTSTSTTPPATPVTSQQTSPTNNPLTPTVQGDDAGTTVVRNAAYNSQTEGREPPISTAEDAQRAGA